MYVFLNHGTVVTLEKVVAVVDAEDAGACDGRKAARGNGPGGTRAAVQKTAVVLEDGRSVLLRSSKETVIRKLMEERPQGGGEKRIGG